MLVFLLDCNFILLVSPDFDVKCQCKEYFYPRMSFAVISFVILFNLQVV